MHKLLAQFGPISNPWCRFNTGSALCTQTGGPGSGLVLLASSLLRAGIVVAGLYALFNFIIAGYQFISAGGDPKNISKAWEKIWQSLIGLLVVAGSLLLAAIIGWLIFNDASAIISPRIYGPGT